MNTRLYRLNEIVGDRKQGIAGMIPMSKAAWYKGMNAGYYPQSVKISERSVAWRSEDIEALVERLKAGNWRGYKTGGEKAES